MKSGKPLQRKTPLRAKPKLRVFVPYSDCTVASGECFIQAKCLAGCKSKMATLPPVPGCLSRDAKLTTKRPKATPARQAAKGKPCMIRVPGICLPGNETVVLCHYRMAGYNGAGLKPDDMLGAWACRACHDCVDGRMKCKFTRDQLRLMHAEGILRTLMQIKAEDIMKKWLDGALVE